jgi:zinc transport system substrate-binding protein
MKENHHLNGVRKEMTRTNRHLQWLMPILLVGCAKEQPIAPSVSPSGPMTVFVDNYPMEYFTARIAGPLAKVILPVPAGRDPAYWKPKEEDIRAIQSADLVVLNGADYSQWSKLVTLAPSKVVDTSRGFKHRFLYIDDAVVHSHGPEGEHSHAGLSSFTWLDFDQAILQAKAIAKALARLRPEAALDIDGRLAALEKDLSTLRDRLQKMAAQKQGPLLASHPVYDYLARHAGWNLKSVHWEPDELPGDEGWAELNKLIENHPAKWMIWEGAPLDETAQRLAALGIQTIVFETLAGRPEQTPGKEADFLALMNGNLDQLERIYRYEPDGSSSAP